MNKKKFLIILIIFSCFILTCIPKVKGDEINDLSTQVKQLFQDKKYKEAIPYTKKLLNLCIKQYGENDYKTAVVYSYLATLYITTKQFKKAKPLFIKVLGYYKKYFGENNVNVAITYNNLAILCLGTYKYNIAEVYCKKALKILEKIKGEKDTNLAAVYYTLAKIYYARKGKKFYKKSEQFFKKALRYFEKKESANEEFINFVYNDLATLYVYYGQYTKSILLLNKLLSRYVKEYGENSPRTAKIYGSLGEMYRRTGHYEDAERFFKKNLEIYISTYGEKNSKATKVYNYLASLYSNIGLYRKAERLYQKKLQISTSISGENNPDNAITYNNLATICDDTGRFKKAEVFYGKALKINKINKFGENNRLVATIYNNLARIYQKTGQYGKAGLFYKKALKIDLAILGGNHPVTATTYNNLALFYSSIGRYNEAERFYKKSIKIIKETLGANHPNAAKAYGNLAGLYRDIYRYRDSELLYKKALKIDLNIWGERNANTKEAYNSLAFLCLATNDVSRAEKIFKKTKSIAGLACCNLKNNNYNIALKGFQYNLIFEKSIGETEYVMSNYIAIGLCYEGLKKYNKAEKAFEKAITLIENQRKSLNQLSRENFLVGKTRMGFSRIDAYEYLIRVILKQKAEKYGEASLKVCERMKAKLFLDMLSKRKIKGKNPLEDKLLAKAEILNTQIATLQNILAIMKNKKVNDVYIKKVETALNKNLNEYDNVLKNIERKGYGLASLVSVKIPDISTLKKNLKTGVKIIEYFVGKNNTYVWVVSRDKVYVKVIPKGGKEIYQVVKATFLSKGISRNIRQKIDFLLPKNSHQTNDPRKFNKAFNILIKPVEKFLKGSDTLIVIPSGALYKLPFCALNDGHRYLYERFNISMLPSFTSLEFLKGKQKGGPEEFFGMANPAIPGVPPLWFSELEVNNISTYFTKKEIYFRSKAKEQTFKQNASSANIIHLAVHGIFSWLQPFDSGLLLRKGGGEDGLLRIYEVFALDLHKSDLVVLSSCESGLGEIRSGDDMIGLSRAFLYAGTPSLIATLWNVDDKATALFMTIFYKNWREDGMSKAKALRMAQKELSSKTFYKSPYYWAAFQIIGDWR